MEKGTIDQNGAGRFAPPQRKPREEAVLHFDSIARNQLIGDLLDAIPDACVLLNREGEIVFANRALIALLDVEDPRSLCGVRPGEALNCVHALERHEGCGATEFCQTCGAVNSILASHSGIDDTRECRILQRDGSALDLRVVAKTISIEGREYTLFSAIDISHEKRRKALERVFFHDILNTAGALYGFSERLGKPSKEAERCIRSVRVLSKRLLEEITAQRELLAAESNELTVKAAFIRTVEFIEAVIEQHDGRIDGKKSDVRIDPMWKNIVFKSDPVLLRRVIANLLKNAVEASKDDDVITIGCRSVSNGVEFWIHNTAVMPNEIQLQVFQRSFSTKGTGRGLGTYGAKLITERYLKGQIWFKSSPDEGTTFTAAYPMDLA